jgi:hypothetical protein
LVENSKGTIPLGKRRRVEVRIILKLVGEGIGWADLVQDTENLLTVVTTVGGSFVTR